MRICDFARAWRAARSSQGALVLFAASAIWPAAGNAVTLKEAGSRALETHPAVSQAIAVKSATEQELRQAKGGYYPSVDLNGSIGREQSDVKSLSSVGTGDRYLTRREFGLTLKQRLFDDFETDNEVARFDALSRAAGSNLSDAREEIAFQSVDAYIEVLRLRSITALAAQNVGDHELAVKQVRDKVVLTGNADLHQAVARLSLAQSTLASREGSLREVATRYQRVVGELPGDLELPERHSSDVVVNGRIDSGRLSRAIESNTDDAVKDHPAMKSAEFGLEAAAAQQEGSRAAYYPRLDLELRVDRDGNIGGVDGKRDTNSVMLVGSWNLFKGGSDQARERALAQRREAAKESIADVRRSIEEQVAIALQAKATSTARLVPLRAHVAASEMTVAAYRAQLTIGRRSLLDLLNAVNELFTARSNLVSGEHADLLNQYYVQASTGKLRHHLGVIVGQ